MKYVLLITLSLVALLQGCEAASDGAKNFCDPTSADFYRRQSTVAWEPVAPDRIAEADYYGRTFEARLRSGEQELFAYKVLMNIRGKPTYVWVALLDQREPIIDVKPLASKSRMRLQDEAMNVAREQHLQEAFIALSSNKYDILLWSWRSSWYFTVDAAEGFSVFEIVGNTVGYVCTYQQ